ncbi:AI-2E family transporter [Nocardioides aurantiacus]|uniref:AI-2E family transporter n=1 Tax=Nocardioides aurantiacus TaxID=86796 RepID=UPI00403F5849
MGVKRGVRDRLRLRGHGRDGAVEGAVEGDVRVGDPDEQTRRDQETRELRERIAAQWAEVRAARRAMDARPELVTGTSNFKRAQVPYGVDLAAAWGWRFIVICGAGLIILYLLQLFMVVVLPLVIALLIAALVSPAVRSLARLGVPHKGAALLVVLLLLALVSVSVTFVGNQVAQGVSDLSQQVGSGLGQIRRWLVEGPLGVTDSQINTALAESQEQLQSFGDDAVTTLSELSATVGHVLAGIFIVLFATYFFLADGALIWTWLVRLFPRAGRLKADSSGRVAWASLTQFVRATVLVAAVDAFGIALGAAVLGVPFVGAIGVLVFIGAFVPMVGAAVSGAVAVLVALVAQGPVTALIMLGVVVLVQQVEAHVLQPFLMGRFVSVHPLGVIVALALGVIVAGIPGALIAVPLAASLNAVVQHLARDTAVGEDAQEAAADDRALDAGGEPA